MLHIPFDVRARLNARSVPTLLTIWDRQAQILATTDTGTPDHDAADLLIALLGRHFEACGSDVRHCDDCHGPHGRHITGCPKAPTHG